ncbi:hypothetical protein [Coxiella-like endosymbiont]|uniref:hypothetical protein n=1 Tax=Coxiella-like endosymbiont TaxID=1592897 RepID=UPI0027295A7D|nr:hypothetical protein [Coxiella-like endosymbiont]
MVNTTKALLSSSIATQLALSKVSGNSPFSQLSKQEMEVLFLLIKRISVTVNGYRYNMFETLGVNNDIGLIKFNQSKK